MGIEYHEITDEALLHAALELCYSILGENTRENELYSPSAFVERLGKYSPILLCACDAPPLVRVDGERSIAAVLGRPESADSLVMGLVACDEAYRRRGITRELVRRFDENAKSLGFKYITLGAADDAWGFYEKCGYSAIAEVHGQRIFQKVL